jgi:hypothetical protein
LLVASAIGAVFMLTSAGPAHALSLPDPLARVVDTTDPPVDPPSTDPTTTDPTDVTPPSSDTEPPPTTGEPPTEPAPGEVDADGIGEGTDVVIDPPPADTEAPPADPTPEVPAAETDPVDEGTDPAPTTPDPIPDPAVDAEPAPETSRPDNSDSVPVSSAPLTSPTVDTDDPKPTPGELAAFAIAATPLASSPPAVMEDLSSVRRASSPAAPVPGASTVADLSTFVTGQLGAAADPRSWSSIGQAAARFGPWIALLLIAFVVQGVARSALRDVLRTAPVRTNRTRSRNV